MNTKLTKAQLEERIRSFSATKTEDELLEEDAHILMANYLSEFERILRDTGITKKVLAELTGISASYLSQVFRGIKPLNFYTIAKIQKKMKVRFDTRAYKIVELEKFANLDKYKKQPKFDCLSVASLHPNYEEPIDTLPEEAKPSLASC